MLKRLIKGIWRGIFKFLFPPRCIFCRKSLAEEGVCDECAKDLPIIKSAIKNPQFVTKTCAPLYYKDKVRASVIRYKFHGKTAYVSHFARIMHEMIQTRIKEKIDCVTWVPLSKRKLKRRGYDQAYLLAKELGKLMDVPVVKTLKKVRDNKSQHKLKNVAERRANVIGAYDNVNDTHVWNKRILIVDDVLTTGATISECARLLKIAGAVDVYVAAVAKTPPKRKKQLKKRKNSL